MGLGGVRQGLAAGLVCGLVGVLDVSGGLCGPAASRAVRVREKVVFVAGHLFREVEFLEFDGVVGGLEGDGHVLVGWY